MRSVSAGSPSGEGEAAVDIHIRPVDERRLVRSEVGDRVGRFLGATRAQYLITTPVTHNANVFAPAQLTLVTSKKPRGERWAPPIAVLARRPEVSAYD